MLIKRPDDVASSEITDERLYRNRRQFLKTAAWATVAAAGGALLPAGCTEPGALPTMPSQESNLVEEPTPYEDITSYNNFYEFGTGKEDPARNAHSLRPKPWTVEVDGLVRNPARWDLDALVSDFTLEDRIYRMRCVEGWSMVVPWYGFPMADLIQKLEPLPSARYVRMESLYDPDQMPGQRSGLLGGLDWPYVEGLRMDEATHALTLMAVGVYGREGPNQNGAPIRLVVPWKYGFKGIKSIVKISFVREQPQNSWQQQAPREYGFFANVNPNVDHPRWSQARERRLGELFRRQTLMFNGYGDQVARMYEGMDLGRHF